MHTPNVVNAWVLQAVDALEGAAPRGVALREIEALTLISTHPGCSSDWLRVRVGLSQSGTVRAVDRLQDLRLVDRARSGREVALSTTPRGERLLRAWQDARGRAVDELLGGLDRRERDRLVQLIGLSLTRRSRERHEADRACRTCEWPRCEPACPVDLSVDD